MTTGTTQKLEGHWDQLSGTARQDWGWITDDELTEVWSDYERLVGPIKERTGEAHEAIEERRSKP